MLSSHRRRHPMLVWLKTGVKKDGTLLAHDCRIVADGGAGTGVGPSTIANAFYFLNLPYVVPNVRFEAIRAYTNRPDLGGPAGQRHPADPLCGRRAARDDRRGPGHRSGRDSAQERRLHRLPVAPNGMKVRSCGLQETITEAVTAADWETEYRPWRQKEGEPLPRIATGVGIACNSFESGARLTGHNCCTAVIKVHEDGTVSLLTGSTDSGQGSETVLAMITAEILGIRLEDVYVPQTDSTVTPVDPGSFGSRVSSTAGNAVKIAAEDAREQLLEVAAELLDAAPEDIEFRDRRVFVKGSPERSMRFRDLARKTVAWGSGTTVIGRGSWGQNIEPMNFDTGVGDSGGAYSFGTQAAWVEVDTETGQVRVTGWWWPTTGLRAESPGCGGTARGLDRRRCRAHPLRALHRGRRADAQPQFHRLRAAHGLRRARRDGVALHRIPRSGGRFRGQGVGGGNPGLHHPGHRQCHPQRGGRVDHRAARHAGEGAEGAGGRAAAERVDEGCAAQAPAEAPPEGQARR